MMQGGPELGSVEGHGLKFYIQVVGDIHVKIRMELLSLHIPEKRGVIINEDYALEWLEFLQVRAASGKTGLEDGAMVLVIRDRRQGDHRRLYPIDGDFAVAFYNGDEVAPRHGIQSEMFLRIFEHDVIAVDV